MPEIIFYIIGFIIVSFSFVVFFGAPYVPTLRPQIKNIMAIYPLNKNDVFVDVGSGDGTVLRAAANHGARAIGYELSPGVYIISKWLCRKQKGIKIYLVNFWKVSLPSDTTVVYTFLNTRNMPKLQKKLQSHANYTGKTLHFISYGFKIPNKNVIRQEGPMYLYRFEALQS